MGKISLSKAIDMALDRLSQAQTEGRLSNDMIADEVERLRGLASRLPKPRKPDTALNRNAKRRLEQLATRKR